MRRALVLVIVVLLAAGMLLAWAWWTAPPAGAAADLAAAAAHAPADAEEVLIVAQPARTARALARHPQALAIAALAIPQVAAHRRELEPAVRACLATSDGPLVVWSAAGEVGLASPAGAGARRALARLAAVASLACREEDGWVVVTHEPRAASARLASPVFRPGSRAAALARVRGRWWRVETARSRLDARTLPDDGGAASPAGPADGPSRLATRDVAPWLAATARADGVLHGPLCLRADATGAWAVRLQGVQPSPAALGWLGGGGASGRWRGVLGEVWGAADSRGLALASGEQELAALQAEACTGESGSVRGADLAALIERLASRLEPLPGLGHRAAGLRRAAPLVAAVRVARWEITDRAGAIAVEW